MMRKKLILAVLSIAALWPWQAHGALWNPDKWSSSKNEPSKNGQNAQRYGGEEFPADRLLKLPDSISPFPMDGSLPSYVQSGISVNLIVVECILFFVSSFTGQG